jgi:hypothetical protein
VTDIVELILGEELRDTCDELEVVVEGDKLLENIVVVEPVVDIIEEAESCVVGDWLDDWVTNVVELILGDCVNDNSAELEVVIEGDTDTELVTVVVVDTSGLGVPDIDWLCDELTVVDTEPDPESEAHDEDEAVRLSEGEPDIVLDTVDDLVIYEGEDCADVVGEIVKVFDILYSGV